MGIQETERFRDDVKVVNFTLLGTPWNIDQVKRRTYNAMPVPSALTHDEYRDGSNDQVVIMNPENWKYFIENNVKGGTPRKFLSLIKVFGSGFYEHQRSGKFLKEKITRKRRNFKTPFGEEKYQRYNFYQFLNLYCL